MNSIIYWKQQRTIVAGTTLRDPNQPECNNMALHTNGDLEQVIENRKNLCNNFGIPLHQFTCACQTHSDHICKIDPTLIGKGAMVYEEGIQDCDALYTHEKNVMLGVFHADCVPILLYDPYTELIAAIHSGWQGTIKEITKKTLALLIEKEHVNPAHIQAYIGPAIAYRSFEVGHDVIEKVQAMSFPTTSFIQFQSNDKALVDNKGLNRQMLLDAGVPLEQIHIDKNDTFMKNEAFFSYRRDHQCGRHLSFIMMR